MTSWLVPSNPNFYDALSAFSKLDEVDWGNGGNNRIEIGDIVFIYISGAMRQIKIKTAVTAVRLTKEELLNNDREFAKEVRENELNNFFRLKKIEIFDDNKSSKLHYDNLINNGLSGSFQGKIKVPERLAQYIYKVENNMANLKDKSYISPKNIILYGPPGVGKTYSHKKLIAILENGDDLENLENPNYDFSAFENIKNEKRHKFITFHQSYSYEDFIEGFRPNEDGRLELAKGIFKDISRDAKINHQLANAQESKKDFESVFKELILDKLLLDEKVTINMKKSRFHITEVSERSIMFDKDSGDSKHTLSISTLRKIYDNNKNNVIFGGLQPYYDALLDFLLSNSKANLLNKTEMKNYYLIIDEINRGNISKIFGELITLIEEDKRLGEPNELTVTLPYSKEPFGIPSNLYIIGTMNTADKSIALVDIALRRRFTFVRMEPRDELLPNEIIQINEIIKNKLGSDYLIGHAFFIDKDGSKIEDDVRLSHIYKYKIKPLIEEYFYADQKIQNELFKVL